MAERGPLVFVFNFSPFNDYEGLQVRKGILIALFVFCKEGHMALARASGGGGPLMGIAPAPHRLPCASS